MLSRVIEWTSYGIEYEADQRHAALIVRDMGLKGSSNAVVTPGGREIGGESKQEVVEGRGAGVQG